MGEKGFENDCPECGTTAHTSETNHLHVCEKCGETFMLPPRETIDFDKIVKEVNARGRRSYGYRLSYEQGQQVAEVLRRYVAEELTIQLGGLSTAERSGLMHPDDAAVAKSEIQDDIDYINGLVKLFEE